ncbi:MAG: phospholipase [Alphaproteobacteria bacterium]|nr:phospholipase [Alphaproteobacteria bacterium]
MLEGPSLLPLSGKKAKKLVVFCHGYGSNGQDLLSLAPYWSRILPEVEFISPNAPEIGEAYPAGYQWFSLKEFTPQAIRIGLNKAVPVLQEFILQALEKRNLTPADLAIVGFSQGGMIALEMIFALPDLKGVISYSGGFYPSVLLTPITGQRTEILLVHGNEDTVVPYEFLSESQEHLRKLGFDPHTLTCSGLGHSIDEEGLKAGGKFLADVLGH